jgi:hypoxanthine phosphoribosyltransferase
MRREPGQWAEVYPDIARVLLSRDQISDRVGRLSRRIARRYEGGELTIVAVLTGSLVFLADLIRELSLPVRVSLVAIRSYPGDATRSQGPRLVLPVDGDLAARNVLLLDDILDGGETLALLARTVEAMSPASLASCVLLYKDRPDRPDRVRPEYVGFDIPDEFVVGYGLDFDDRYRNLPDICVLKSLSDTRGPGAASAGEST